MGQNLRGLQTQYLLVLHLAELNDEQKGIGYADIGRIIDLDRERSFELVKLLEGKQYIKYTLPPVITDFRIPPVACNVRLTLAGRDVAEETAAKYSQVILTAFSNADTAIEDVITFSKIQDTTGLHFIAIDAALNVLAERGLVRIDRLTEVHNGIEVAVQGDIEFTDDGLDVLKSNVISKTQAVTSVENQQYDCFVCHCSEDKEDYVDELVKEMRSQGIATWYDSTEIQWGSSVSKAIENGLQHSTYGITVISESFIGRTWPEREIRTMLALDSISILPLLLDVTHKQFAKAFPLLADISYEKANKAEISKTVEKLKNLLR